MTSGRSLRFGFGTNGFGSHRLNDALAVIADLGYDGVALTLDHPHLDPFDTELSARTAKVGRRLDELGLAVVVETGARYVLDPWHKHEPTLVSAGDRTPRLELLRRAVEVAADLGAEAVSFWSGIRPAGTDDETAWGRLTGGVAAVLDFAQQNGVTCAFEPEPGMFVDTLATALELRRRLGEPEPLKITLDLGHCVAAEPEPAPQVILQAGALLANVQADDMRRGVHEHLEFGDGELDLPAAFGALLDVDYRGLVAVELPRHGHAAPVVAQRSLAAMRSALAEVEDARR
jgi:sugar phosphate isomerase/epimerase